MARKTVPAAPAASVPAAKPAYYLVGAWAPQPRMDGDRQFTLTDRAPEAMYHYPIRDAYTLQRMGVALVFEGDDALQRATAYCEERVRARRDFASRATDDRKRSDAERQAYLDREELARKAQAAHYASGRMRSVYECMLDLLALKERPKTEYVRGSGGAE